MGQVLFIVWRESVEALLVVGILHAWLKNGGADVLALEEVVSAFPFSLHAEHRSYFTARTLACRGGHRHQTDGAPHIS